MIDFSNYVRPGDSVWWSQGAAEPAPLVNALLDQLTDIGPIRAFVGLSWNPRVTQDPPPLLHLSSYGALGDLRHLPQGRLEVLRVAWSNLPEQFAHHNIGSDIGIVQVSPPDAHGNCSLGLGADYAWDAAQYTQTLIAEINASFTSNPDAPSIPLARFDAVVHTDRPLLAVGERKPRSIDNTIAAHIAALIDDGDTIQTGVGQLPSALLSQLTGHTDLGIHSGVVTDGIAELVDLGVITGARKEIDAGLVVAGAALGSIEFYERASHSPFAFRPVSYTHNHATLRKFTSLVAVNSAVEVDLSGAVNAEIRNGQYVGAVGGQPDFAHAASRTGKLSIIALPAETGGASTIVASVGTVTTSAADIDVVVTEYGAAHLTGCEPAERARRLIEIAAPAHQEQLDHSLFNLTRA